MGKPYLQPRAPLAEKFVLRRTRPTSSRGRFGPPPGEYVPAIPMETVASSPPVPYAAGTCTTVAESNCPVVTKVVLSADVMAPTKCEARSAADPVPPSVKYIVV